MRTLIAVALSFLVLSCARAEAPTERYAPAQLHVARSLLEHARAAAALGEVALARRLAWQATFDARLAWGMTDSTYLRAEAAEVGGAASALVTRLGTRQ